MEKNSGDMMGTSEARHADAAYVGVVERQAIALAWPIVEEWIDAALSASVQHELTIDEVRAGCETGDYLMLLIGARGTGPDAASDDAQAEGALVWRRDVLGVVVLARSTQPDGTPYVAIICAAGTHVERWLSHVWGTVVQIAAHHGARQLVAMGRPGWEPMLRALGAKRRAVVWSYELTDAECNVERGG